MKHVIGIDIGSIYTKMVEVEVSGKLTVVNTFFTPTLFVSNARESGIDVNAVCQEIVKKMSLNHLKESRIAINIPIFSPVVTTIVLPRMNKKELKVAALTEARRKMIPQPGPNSIFETAFLGEIVEASIPRYEVLVVREEKEFVTVALDFFKELGIYPYVVAPTCASLGSIFARKAEYRNKEVAFIDLGHGSMNISISRGTNVIFNRSISFGCKDIIQGLASGLGVSYQQAENTFLKNGIPDVKFDPKDRVAIAEEIMRQKYEAGAGNVSGDDANSLELRMLMEPFLERIIQEIRRTFIYFKERYEARKIERIFFLGGGALINNLVSIVGKKISPLPETMDIGKVAGISFADGQYKDKLVLFSGAMSLALSTTLKIQETINFLPFELKRKEEIAIKRSVFIAVSIFLIAGFILGWMNFWIMSINVRKSLKRVNFELERLHNTYAEENKLSGRMRFIEKRYGIVKSLAENQKDFIPVLGALAFRETDNMFFSYLYIGEPEEKPDKAMTMGRTRAVSVRKEVPSKSIYKKYILELKVNVLGDYEKSCGIMKKFITELKKRPYFNNVKLIPPDISTITPVVKKGNISITGVKWQKFTVEAELNI